MNQGWATALLLAFGIAVGVIGVVAYLRMLRKEKAPVRLTDADAPLTRSHSLEEKAEAERKIIKD